jgi:hypothetical protein
MRVTHAETTVVYAAGAAQGIVLVTFLAASTIFTDSDRYDLSNTQYGLLFLPQVATAILASLLGASFGRRFGTKRGLSGWSRLRAGVDAPSDRQSVLRVGAVRRVSALARCDGVPRRRLRPHRSGAEHIDRGLSRGRCRIVGSRPRRAARAGHGACTGVRRDLRRAGILVGSSGDVGDPAGRATPREPRASVAFRGPRGGPSGPRRQWVFPGASGCMPPSPSSTACARR